MLTEPDLQNLKRQLDSDGYCIVERALDPDLLCQVQKRLFEQAQAERASTTHLRNFAHRDTSSQWVNMLLNKGEIFQHLVLHPLSLLFAEHVLGSGFLSSCCDAQIKHPGARAMKLHSDQWWMPKPVAAQPEHPRSAQIERNVGTRIEPRIAEQLICPPVVVVTMWLITGFTKDNGATRFVPGSHLSGVEPDPSVPHKVKSSAAVAPAGSLLVLDGRTWHGSGDNDSDISRFAITCNYCAPQFRPMENYTCGLRDDVLRHASRDLLHLLGFRAWDVYGHTGDPDRDIAREGDNVWGELRPGDLS